MRLDQAAGASRHRPHSSCFTTGVISVGLCARPSDRPPPTRVRARLPASPRFAPAPSAVAAATGLTPPGSAARPARRLRAITRRSRSRSSAIRPVTWRGRNAPMPLHFARTTAATSRASGRASARFTAYGTPAAPASGVAQLHRHAPEPRRLRLRRAPPSAAMSAVLPSPVSASLPTQPTTPPAACRARLPAAPCPPLTAVRAGALCTCARDAAVTSAPSASTLTVTSEADCQRLEHQRVHRPRLRCGNMC